MRRALVAAVVAILAVTAGCNAVLDGESTPTPSGTPTATPTSGQPSPTSDLRPGRIGIAADGVSDPLRLANAHTTSLQNVSYRMRYRRVATAPNGTRLGAVRRDARVSDGRQRFSFTRTRTGVYDDPNHVASLRAFATTSRGFLAWRFAGTRSYQRLYRYQMPVRINELTGKTRLYLAFSGVDTRVTDVARANGTTVLRLASTDGPHAFRDVPVRNLTLTATVERSGRVRSLRIEYDRVGPPESPLAGAHVVEELRFEGFDRTTVPEPAWVQQVRNNTSALPDEDGAGE